MKVKSASFSSYKVVVNNYVFEKLDLFSFLFTQILIDENIDKNKLIIDCLNDLDIKEDLYYLFNNVYYKLIDNLIVKNVKEEDIAKLKIKDIEIDPRFVSHLKKGYLPVLDKEIEKDFVYDYVDGKIVLAENDYTDSNIFILEINNDINNIERIINSNTKALFNISEGFSILKEMVVDPYYFEIQLLEKDDYYYIKENTKENIYSSLSNNSLFLKDEILKGDFLSNNIYFKCLYSDLKLDDYCDYLFMYDKEKEFVVENKIIYVGFKFEDDFLDLKEKESYKVGKYLLENGRYISTCIKSKSKNISEFKLYLVKNKDKFSENIDKIIDLI